MAKGARWRTAKEAAAELLRKGMAVTPQALAEMAQLTVPENVAYRSWLVNFTRSAAHEAAKELGITIMAVGDGQGYREPQTPEEWEEAQRRSEVQIKAQARRRKAIKSVLKYPNQHYFPLEEVPADAGGDGATDKPSSQSA